MRVFVIGSGYSQIQCCRRILNTCKLYNLGVFAIGDWELTFFLPKDNLLPILGAKMIDQGTTMSITICEEDKSTLGAC